jgi:hypothetical protein
VKHFGARNTGSSLVVCKIAGFFYRRRILGDDLLVYVNKSLFSLLIFEGVTS